MVHELTQGTEPSQEGGWEHVGKRRLGPPVVCIR